MACTIEDIDLSCKRAYSKHVSRKRVSPKHVCYCIVHIRSWFQTCFMHGCIIYGTCINFLHFSCRIEQEINVTAAFHSLV